MLTFIGASEGSKREMGGEREKFVDGRWWALNAISIGKKIIKINVVTKS